MPSTVKASSFATPSPPPAAAPDRVPGTASGVAPGFLPWPKAMLLNAASLTLSARPVTLEAGKMAIVQFASAVDGG